MAAEEGQRREVFIRLFYETPHGAENMGQDWSPEDFGGTIPIVGDLILDPAVGTNGRRYELEEREVHEVVQRWFYPGQHFHVAGLLVRTRKVQRSEIEMLPG